jgi:hypothetical protein
MQNGCGGICAWTCGSGLKCNTATSLCECEPQCSGTTTVDLGAACGELNCCYICCVILALQLINNMLTALRSSVAVLSDENCSLHGRHTSCSIQHACLAPNSVAMISQVWLCVKSSRVHTEGSSFAYTYCMQCHSVENTLTESSRSCSTCQSRCLPCLSCCRSNQ